MTELERVDGIAGNLVLPASAYRRNRRPWLEARRSGLGASDMAGVLGISDFTTPLKVWMDKVNPVTSDDFPSEAAEFGALFEDPVARKFAQRHPEVGKLAPTPGILAHAEHRWMLATLDRLIVPRGQRGGTPTSCLEVKTSGEWPYRERWIDGQPPDYIMVQLQQQLAVTGFEYLWLVVVVGGQHMPEPIRVTRDEAVIDQLVRYGGLWWHDHVDLNVRPEVSWADRHAFAQVYPGDESLPAVLATDELEGHLAAYLDARRTETEGKAVKEAMAFRIRSAMGDAQAVKNRAGDVIATWKAGTEHRLDTKRLGEDHPELVADYSPARPTRRLLVKTPRR